jgi:diacylglycerol kinase (ATP)
VSLAGFYFKITASEWLFQTLAIGLVMSVEGINTAVEKIADFIHPNYNEKLVSLKISQLVVFFCSYHCNSNWFNHMCLYISGI